MRNLVLSFIFVFVFGCESVNEPNTFTLSKNTLQNVNGNQVTFLGIFEKERLEPNHLLQIYNYMNIEVNSEYYEFKLDQTFYHTRELCFRIINVSNNELTIEL